MKRIRLTLFAIIALLAAACSTSKYVAESAPVINEITIVAPYSRVDVLETRTGKFFYSDSLSFVSEMMIGSTLETMGLPIVRVISVLGRSNQEALDQGYEAIADIQTSKLESARVSPAMQAFLSTYSTRYALLTFAEGFVRSNPNVYLGEGQIRYASNIFMALVDARTGKIVYYNRSCPEEADPVSGKSVSRRVKALAEGINVVR